MSEIQNALVLAPVPDAAEYTVSSEIWEALTREINVVVARIEAGENLEPEDVKQVRSLKKQVESYLTTFNKAMRNAQASYKSLIAQQLNDLGYDRIEAYITKRREEQTKEQNDRLAAKQTKLREIVERRLKETKLVKGTALAGEMLPAFAHRFPNMNSSAKDKNILNWEPYEATIKTVLNMLDVFFADPIFPGAVNLPITSATMQQLLAYVRDGDLEHLKAMRQIYAQDKPILEEQKLRLQITDKEIALAQITAIIEQEGSTEEKLCAIGKIIRIAEQLPVGA